MKVQLLSDLHVEFDAFSLETNDADVLVLAGDIHVKDKGLAWALENVKDKPVIYVLGNHEYYGKSYPKHADTLKTMAKGTNVHVLEKDVFTLGDVNFFGCTLWTDFELFGDARLTGYECQQIMSDFKKIRVSPAFSKLRAIDVSMIHRQSLQWLEKALAAHQGEKNVVITHHGPSRDSLPETGKADVISAAYVSDLSATIETYKPQYWLHGHLHNSSNYHIAGCQVICNPRGYPSERNSEFRLDCFFSV